MGIELDISTRQSTCFPGDVIQGTVRLNVTAKDAGSPAGSLVIRLVGLAKTRAMFIATGVVPTTSGAAPYTYRDMLSEDVEFLGYDVQLADFGGKAASGEHTYDFSVTLPPSLPASMKEQGGNGSCAIAYGFRARLHRPGLLNFDAKGKVQLKVLGKPEETSASSPVVAGPAVKAVKKCYCLQSGSMSLGFQADRSVVGLNESVGVIVVARNDSSVAVKNLRVELVQETSWTANGAGDVSTRVVKSVVVPGAELGAAEFGGQRGQSAAAIADTARADLERQLASGAGTRHELTVPADTSITLNSETIQVRHVLTVRIQGPRCVECPDVWTSLHVQPGTSGVVPKVHEETSSLAPSSTARPVTVTVPPSAVKLAYNHEQPRTSGTVGKYF
ncbi:unnamed protein product [Ectocarpus sp. CCAP 1310/34]|nr:unnamed protein product [Ectocarpus sp. CCAP 1310/34]